jgi:hypothetical protein
VNDRVFRGICADKPAFTAADPLPLPRRFGAYSPRGSELPLKMFLVSSIRQGRDTPEKSEKFGIEDQLQFPRLVSVRPGASFGRGSRVDQGAQRAFPKATVAEESEWEGKRVGTTDLRNRPAQTCARCRDNDTMPGQRICARTGPGLRCLVKLDRPLPIGVGDPAEVEGQASVPRLPRLGRNCAVRSDALAFAGQGAPTCRSG